MSAVAPALDRYARRFLDLVAAGSAGGEAAPDVFALRRANDALAAFAAPPPCVERRDVAAKAKDGVPAMRVYSPPGAPPRLPTLVFFHGGGWISGSLDTHDALAATLAAGAGCRIVAVDYRLAPEHRFPAAYDDAFAALAAVAAAPEAFGADPARLGVAGDSIGANLAIAAARDHVARGDRLALQVLLCPVLDPVGRTQSRRRLARGHLVGEATLGAFWDAFQVDGLAPDDPRVAPLRGADLAGLPPARIHSAEFDPLVDEAALYAVALREAGVAARLTRHDGLIHHFYGLTGVIPAARVAMDAIAADIREAFAALER